MPIAVLEGQPGGDSVRNGRLSRRALVQLCTHRGEVFFLASFLYQPYVRVDVFAFSRFLPACVEPGAGQRHLDGELMIVSQWLFLESAEDFFR